MHLSGDASPLVQMKHLFACEKQWYSERRRHENGTAKTTSVCSTPRATGHIQIKDHLL
jgi:hypothetical protein